MTSCGKIGRRRVLATGAAFGAALALPARAQESTSTAAARADSAESDRIAAEFLNGVTPIAAGLVLEVPALADNPAAVPVRVHVTEAMTEDSYCTDLILLAERNPMPLACAFTFTAAAGSADAAVRLRLIESMKLRALARMSDGRVLEARADTTVAAGGCGM